VEGAMNVEAFLATLSFFLLGCLLLLRIISLFFRNKALHYLGYSFLILVIIALALSTGIRTYRLAFVAVTTLFESIVFLSLVIAVIDAVLYTRLEKRALFHFFMSFVLFCFLALASSPIIPKSMKPLVPALQSFWLLLHVTFSIIGEGFFTGAFVASILILTGREREREALSALQHRFIIIGYPIFTAGALIFGAIWARSAWGNIWSWDPKETWALVSWLIFTLYLHVRRLPRWRGKRAAWFVVIGWVSLIFTFFGVNFLLSGLHSY
jgi:ABC-type transport system involved in cytochrome c biogenesis permease subunit